MPSGKVERRTYDLRRRLTEQTITLHEQVILRREYSYNARGQVLAIRDSRRGQVQFTYDALGRLQSVQPQEGQHRQRFHYSHAGDLLIDGWQYAPGHRVYSMAGYALEYDNRGFVVRRRSSLRTDQFSYTIHGLLQQAQMGDGTRVYYAYDGHSRLVEKRTDAHQCRYYWNSEQLWAMQEDGSPLMEFLYLPTSLFPLEQCQGHLSYSIHTDHQGKIQELIDDNGTVVWVNPSDVWGAGRRPALHSSQQPESPFGFPGQLWDAYTGFFYNRYRYYFPEAAHYLTPDPIGIWGGLDAYRYPQDPINIIDPRGLKCRGKNDDPILYRSDDRLPDEICRDGFTPQNPNAGLTVFQHVEGVPPGGSNWIATSHSQDWAENQSLGRDRVYVILNPGCGVEVDCDPDVMAKYGPDPPGSEHEIVFDTAIPPNKIVGFFSRSNGGMASFQACP